MPAAPSKSSSLRRTFSRRSNSSMAKEVSNSTPLTSEQRTLFATNSSYPNAAPEDQTKNPDVFDDSINDFLGTNNFGVVTGFRRVTQPTMGEADDKHGNGTRDVAVDSGIFRRYGYHKQLVDGSTNLNPKYRIIDRPLPTYIDGTAGSMFDRAVLNWPNGEFFSVRERDASTRKMKTTFKARTFSEMNSFAEDLAKAILGYNLVSRREFHDEQYPPAQKLSTIGMLFPNREEFHLVEQAMNKINVAMVPAYPSLGMDSCKAIFQEVQASTLITDYPTLIKLTSASGTKAGSLGIEHLVLLDSVQNDATQRELAYWVEGTKEFEHLRSMMNIIGVKHCIRFSNLVSLGANIKNATKYDGRTRPKVAPISKSYVNPSFAVSVDGDKIYNESPFAAHFNAMAPPKSVVFEQSTPSDVQTICYTSGTTGMPKGVIITHENCTSVAIAGASGCFQTAGMTFGTLETGADVTEMGDSSYSVLPLVHVFERLITNFCYVLGIGINMFSQDPSQLVPEMKMCQPSIFIGVPRLFQKILAGIDELVNQKSFIVKTLYNKGLESKSYYSEQEGATTHALWDNVVFNKIKSNVCGDKLKLILTGAAPFAPSTQYRVESLLSLNMVEGYGLTECMGGCAVRLIGDAKGSVGTVLPSIELKLGAVPEMDLVDVRDQMKGEIMIRGNSVTPGYFRRPDLNNESFTDGWFHTGDVGQIQGGLLSIRDRKKAIFKLAQGEYISPERLEGFLLSAINWLEAIMVTGRSTSRFACALAVLNPLRIEEWTQGNVAEDSSPELKADWEKFLNANQSMLEKRFIATQLENMKVFDIQGYEKVTAVKFLPYNITDSELVTPTMKLKRNKVRKFYEDDIDTLCDRIDAANQ